MGKWDDVKMTKAGDSKTWKPEKAGDKIIGQYLAKKENVGENNSMMYMLEVEEKDGSTEVYGVWGSTVLDDRFIEVKIGEIVKVEYLGKKASKGGRSFHAYELFHGMPDDLDPSKVFDGNLPEA